MAYFVAKLFATALVVLLPITKLYFDYNGPLCTKTEERIGFALAVSTMFCAMGTLTAIVFAVLP